MDPMGYAVFIFVDVFVLVLTIVCALTFLSAHTCYVMAIQVPFCSIYFATLLQFRSSKIWVFPKIDTPKSSILIRFSIINHPFWGTPTFGTTHIHYGFDIQKTHNLFMHRFTDFLTSYTHTL